MFFGKVLNKFVSFSVYFNLLISAPIKVFRLDSDRFKNLSDTEPSTFNSGAEQYCSGAETASKAAFLV